MSNAALRVLVWHWGRRGAGPHMAVELQAGLSALPGVTAQLSLAADADPLNRPQPPACALIYPTYASMAGFAARLVGLPWLLPHLIAKLRRLAPDIAVCAMPAPLDFLMAAALRCLGIPYVVFIHDADLHPGDGVPLQMRLQRLVMGGAAGFATMSDHVAGLLEAQGAIGTRPLTRLYLPPFDFGPIPPAPRSHGGPLRLLFFGRLLPYKGLDLLEAALRHLAAECAVSVRVVGSGPETPTLAALRALPQVQVENRWVQESEIGPLLAWSDALVLSYTEASQSGVAAAAQAARRWIIATAVGGLSEQLADEPLARLCAPTPEAVAEAIRSLLSAPPVDTGAPRGRSWRDMAAALLPMLRQSVGP